MRTHTAPETTPTATAVPVAPVHRSGRWVDHWDPEDPTLLARRRLGDRPPQPRAVGLRRVPGLLKLGDSGCARECAGARAKDGGVIATDHGRNLSVGGNGGFTPRHAQLLAEDLDTDTLVRAGDRFLMYYVRTADRLQRTAAWVEEYEGGGPAAIRSVVLQDSLRICDDLDAAMAAHVESYEDEWAAVPADPERLQRFGSFVHAPAHADHSFAYVREGGQARPATEAQRGDPAVLIAGTTVEVHR